MKNAKGHQNQEVSDEMKALFLFWHHFISFPFSISETHCCWTEQAEYLENDDEDDEKQTIGEAPSTGKDSPLVEYLENDDEDDEKQTIGEALSAAKYSPLLDVSRAWFKAISECNDVGVMCLVKTECQMEKGCMDLIVEALTKSTSHVTVNCSSLCSLNHCFVLIVLWWTGTCENRQTNGQETSGITV